MRPCAKYFACALFAALVFVRCATAQSGEAPKKDPQLLEKTLPVRVGDSAKGIWFPDWEDGKLKMTFYVDVMQRTDLQHVRMTNAKLITCDDQGKTDLTLLLPVSTFNLRTRVLATDKPFVLEKTDFELMGDALQLDTLTRQATIVGKVKMIIYNFEEPARKESAPVNE